MEWQPQEEPLGQLAYCLRDSLNSYNSAAQKQAEQVCCAFVFKFKSLYISPHDGWMYHLELQLHPYQACLVCDRISFFFSPLRLLLSGNFSEIP